MLQGGEDWLLHAPWPWCALMPDACSVPSRTRQRRAPPRVGLPDLVMDTLCSCAPGNPTLFCSGGTVTGEKPMCHTACVTSLQPRTVRLGASYHMQVRGPSAVASRSRPRCSVEPGGWGWGMQRQDSSPSVREGGRAGAPAPLGCHGRPVTGSHSPPGEEEFSHRLTQQGSLSQCGEVSAGPFPRTSEECNAK